MKTETSNNTLKKIAIVGFGKLGLLHSGVFNAHEAGQVGFIVDSSSTMLSLLKSKMPQIQIFESHSDLLKNHASEISAAVIATPSQIHVPIALDFIEKNIPLLIEKPLSTTSAQALPLVKKLRQNNVANRVGYMARFVETFGAAKKIIEGQSLGRLQSLRCTMYIGQLFRQGKGWRYSKEASGGGVLITQNSHLLDLLTWMLGDIAWVSANAKKLYSKEVEDEMHAYLGFECGLEGWIDSSWSMRHHRTLTMSIQLQGENGTLSVSEDEVSLFLNEATKNKPAGWTHLRKPDLFRGVEFDVAGPQYSAQADEFLAVVNGGSREIRGADIESSYKIQQVIDAIYQSAEQKGAPQRLVYG